MYKRDSQIKVPERRRGQRARGEELRAKSEEQRDKGKEQHAFAWRFALALSAVPPKRRGHAVRDSCELLDPANPVMLGNAGSAALQSETQACDSSDGH